jgi:hypothetical protein
LELRIGLDAVDKITPVPTHQNMKCYRRLESEVPRIPDFGTKYDLQAPTALSQRKFDIILGPKSSTYIMANRKMTEDYSLLGCDTV